VLDRDRWRRGFNERNHAVRHSDDGGVVFDIRRRQKLVLNDWHGQHPAPRAGVRAAIVTRIL